MANKVVAFFVMCLVLVAAVQLPSAAADDAFSSCFKNCEKECQAVGGSSTFCEMKCDTDCFDKDVAARLHQVYG